MAPRTLYNKIVDDHIVYEQDGTMLLYIDRHIIHEVTSPQAFEGLRNAGRKVRRPDLSLVTADHNVPTSSRRTFKNARTFIAEPDSRLQVMTLDDNVKAFGLHYFGMKDARQGIVHVIGPEQGFCLPCTTIVCGDSHTSTNGAFGALAFGIGTSEVEHVLATQTILQKRAKNMRIRVNGQLAAGVTSKDIVLHIIGVIGTAGGTGCVIEYCGDTIQRLSMEGRMSICNMSIEAGARAGLIAPDEITFAYLKDRPLTPKGTEWDAAVEYWTQMRTDTGAIFDVSIDIDAANIQPTVSWGTSPQDVVAITGTVPDPAGVVDVDKRKGMERALEYMSLSPGMKMEDIMVDKVFIGSCTNSRIEDLRAAASIAAGRRVAEHVYAMVVPGSGLVKEQAEREGLDRIFIDAGFDWREAGCSMCLGMNEDKLKPGERCASTSNRNFQNRQGPGGRTHLMSPAMAVAAAVHGRLKDVRTLQPFPNSGAVVRPSVSVALYEDPPAPLGESEEEEPSVISDAQSQSAGAPAGHIMAMSPGLPKFTVLKGVAAPIDRSNVDTDLIIQARHLKTIARTGLGQHLFEALRADRKGQMIPTFFMNQPKYDAAPILVASGPNFGCGSSREHAGWSLIDRGIRCVIASSFGDIFATNYGKNGALTVTLPINKVADLFQDACEAKTLEIDLPNQVVRRENGETLSFDVDAFRKNCLIEGRDDIGLTELRASEISAYEAHRKLHLPWNEGINTGTRVLAPLVGRQQGVNTQTKQEW